MTGSMHAALASLSPTPHESAIALSRGSSFENLRSVAMSKVMDAHAALRELEAVTLEDGARFVVQSLQATLL